MTSEQKTIKTKVVAAVGRGKGYALTVETALARQMAAQIGNLAAVLETIDHDDAQRIPPFWCHHRAPGVPVLGRLANGP